MAKNQPTMKTDEQPEELPSELIIGGQSDGLIEVYGDVHVKASKDWGEAVYAVFNNGTILKMVYGDQTSSWHIDIVNPGGGMIRSYPWGDYTGEAPVGDHSDVVVIEAPQQWMAIDGDLIDFTPLSDGSNTYTLKPE